MTYVPPVFVAIAPIDLEPGRGSLCDRMGGSGAGRLLKRSAATSASGSQRVPRQSRTDHAAVPEGRGAWGGAAGGKRTPWAGPPGGRGPAEGLAGSGEKKGQFSSSPSVGGGGGASFTTTSIPSSVSP